jgi:multimeric flavodoxin WrbA
MRPRLLVVHHSHGWRTTRMADAIAEAARRTGAVEVRSKRAADATLDDLIESDGYLFGTPETFGSLSGMLKDFFERTYYPAQGRLQGRPYAIFVCAGNDGAGAIAAIQRIARGYAWKAVQAPLLVPSDALEQHLLECEELGTTMALGLAMGLF